MTPENPTTCVSCGKPGPTRGGRCAECQNAERELLPPAAKFWPQVDTSAGPHGCWIWTGKRTPFGHGIFGRHARFGGDIYAHRFSWESANGPIPAGLCVCHRCDNPTCCNPAHLFVGTQRDNMRDAARKGRLDLSGLSVGRRGGEWNPQSKLTERQALDIIQRRAGGESTYALAREFGVSQPTISDIVNGRTWRHLPRPHHAGN